MSTYSEDTSVYKIKVYARIKPKAKGAFSPDGNFNEILPTTDVVKNERIEAIFLSYIYI